VNEIAKQTAKFKSFNIAAYRKRLRILREIVAGDSQQDFARKIGIELKRWNNYERGYPVPREVAFIIRERLPGMCVTWLWWGDTGNVTKHWLDKIEALENADREQEKALEALKKAQEAATNAAAKRKRVSRPLELAQEPPQRKRS
jgi:hypothetical protein